MRLGELLGAGRTADVFAIDEAWVLRRTRDGRGVAAEGRVMSHLREHGYPVPRVRAPGTPGTDPATDLVMERLPGPTMLESLSVGATTPEEAGTVLAGLLRRLHEVPALVAAAPGHRVLHLDLHPDNVMLTPTGPVVIDWSNTEEGAPAFDWAMSALILAQVAVADPALEDPARVMLAALLAHGGRDVRLGDGVSGPLSRARARRETNPTMTESELLALDDAVALVLAARPPAAG